MQEHNPYTNHGLLFEFLARLSGSQVSYPLYIRHTSIRGSEGYNPRIHVQPLRNADAGINRLEFHKHDETGSHSALKNRYFYVFMPAFPVSIYFYMIN
jgi:hypothetical protein